MRILLTQPFKKDFQELPKEVQTQTEKTLQLLVANFHHPSLCVKKMKGRESVWEARVTHCYRLTFQKTADILILRRIGKHDILRRP